MLLLRGMRSVLAAYGTIPHGLVVASAPATLTAAVRPSPTRRDISSPYYGQQRRPFSAASSTSAKEEQPSPALELQFLPPDSTDHDRRSELTKITAAGSVDAWRRVFGPHADDDDLPANSANRCISDQSITPRLVYVCETAAKYRAIRALVPTGVVPFSAVAMWLAYEKQKEWVINDMNEEEDHSYQHFVDTGVLLSLGAWMKLDEISQLRRKYGRKALADRPTIEVRRTDGQKVFLDFHFTELLGYLWPAKEEGDRRPDAAVMHYGECLTLTLTKPVNGGDDDFQLKRPVGADDPFCSLSPPDVLRAVNLATVLTFVPPPAAAGDESDDPNAPVAITGLQQLISVVAMEADNKSAPPIPPSRTYRYVCETAAKYQRMRELLMMRDTIPFSAEAMWLAFVKRVEDVFDDVLFTGGHQLVKAGVLSPGGQKKLTEWRFFRFAYEIGQPVASPRIDIRQDERTYECFLDFRFEVEFRFPDNAYGDHYYNKKTAEGKRRLLDWLPEMSDGAGGVRDSPLSFLVKATLSKQAVVGADGDYFIKCIDII